MSDESNADDVIPVAVPQWADAGNGYWTREWRVVLAEPTTQPPPYLSEGEIEAVTEIGPDARTLTIITRTKGNAWSDDNFVLAAWRMLKRIDNQMGRIETIQGQPRTWWQPFRPNGVEVRTIDQVRIDIPLRTTVSYFFIAPECSDWWNPWWKALFDFLCGLDRDPQWVNADNSGAIAHVSLTEESRRSVFEFLCTAPPSEIERSRPLRRALGMTPEQVGKLGLMYASFSALATESNPRS